MTGVTTFMLDKDIDTGGIILRQEYRISLEDTAGTLHDKLMEIGAKLVVETTEGIFQKNVETRVQRSFIQGSEVLRSAPKLSKENTRINWSVSADDIYNFVRGLSPYPAAWTTLTALGATLTYNWNIRIYVEDAAGHEYVLGQDLPENYQITSGELAVNRTETRDRDVTAYKIYRDTILIDEVPGTQLTYTDMNVEGGLHTYYVTAMYGTNESLASNTVTAFVLPATYAEMMNDDGAAEAGYSVGSTRQQAAKFMYGDALTVKYAKVFVHTQGTAGIIIRVFDDNGTDGMPGTQMAQFQYPAANVVPGWNFISLPENIIDANGTFYIAILETAGASQIGLDTNHTGHSYKKLTTAWEPITEGDVMIRAIVEPSTGNEVDVTVPVFSANNYPNPFNPSTTIAYSIPTASNTSLRVYNIKGQVVKTLVNGVVEAGNHSITWNGRDDNGTSVASGVYFYRLSSEGQTITKKMVLSK